MAAPFVWCLGASLILHVLALLALVDTSMRSEIEPPKILRVAILDSKGSGAEPGGGPLAGPPPVLEAPKPVAPPKVLAPPQAKPKKPQVKKEPAPREAMPKPIAPAPVIESAPSAPAPVEGSAQGSEAASGETAGGEDSGGSGQGGGGGGKGRGRGGTAGDGAGSILGAYLARVRQRIETAKRYPIVARRSHLEGRVAVSFELNRSGEPQAIKVVSTDHAVLGDAAVVAVQAAAPFGRLPDEFEEESVRVEVPLRFSLRDQ